MPIIITKICEQCGESFSGPQFSTKRRKFCSHDCYAENRTADLTGKTFGRLTAQVRVGKKRWLSNCECGGTAISATQSLIEGHTKSCGCLSRDTSARLSKTHGASNTRAHNTWSGIIQRCTNPNTPQFSDYGGRGITVCKEWRDFAVFLSDMGQPPIGRTIERVNNDKGYCKENCVWATRTEQQRNRRVVAKYAYAGKDQCLSQWAEDYGIAQSLVLSRIFVLKWSLEEALEIIPRSRPTQDRAISSRSRWVEFNGRRQYLDEWCRELGINSKTVHSRIARGSSDLAALGLA